MSHAKMYGPFYQLPHLSDEPAVLFEPSLMLNLYMVNNQEPNATRKVIADLSLLSGFPGIPAGPDRPQATIRGVSFQPLAFYALSSCFARDRRNQAGAAACESKICQSRAAEDRDH